ncbi:uncharacterized protein LOC131437228 [Malaya genurostris]|uniref:uncharacterized protein LOC131437228 n=1 Tax=Malaya genurostris TaxID=325434 RepID=UPI0026F3831F|nr:uncharacterized protein LOC131437228 [Malaya genurostris]
MNLIRWVHKIQILVILFAAVSCLSGITENEARLTESTSDDRLIGPKVPLNLNQPLSTRTGTIANRSKRAIIFRPLFVYRQQQIKKQRQHNAEQQTAAAGVAASNFDYVRYPQPTTQYSGGSWSSPSVNPPGCRCWY